MLFRALLVLVLASAVATAAPVVGFRVEGDSKLDDSTLSYLTRVRLGDDVDADDLPRIVQALITSELFEKVDVRYEDAADGVVIVATLDDKHSWVVAPTLYLLSGNYAVGAGFAENNLAGKNQKLLLYGQYGSRESLFFGTFLDPSVRGTRLTYRFDIFTYRRYNAEYANPYDDAADASIARTAQANYLGGGILVGYNVRWWLVVDARLRGAYVFFRDATAPDGSALPVPQDDGFDISQQVHVTLDARKRYFGVTWGPYAQLTLDKSIPGLDDYGYGLVAGRAYYSWRLFDAHQLELRVSGGIGYHLPFHEELTTGGVLDLRGYAVDRFRGDLRGLFRTEYSVPIVRWGDFAFRAITFFDTGYTAFKHVRDDRDYLGAHPSGRGWWRSDVGAGIRLYVKSIVLPLLGLDVGYGLEGRAPELYFQVGLTDF